MYTNARSVFEADCTNKSISSPGIDEMMTSQPSEGMLHLLISMILIAASSGSLDFDRDGTNTRCMVSLCLQVSVVLDIADYQRPLYLFELCTGAFCLLRKRHRQPQKLMATKEPKTKKLTHRLRRSTDTRSPISRAGRDVFRRR